MFWGDGGIEPSYQGANMRVQRVNSSTIKRDRDSACSLPLPVSSLFLRWGQCRSGAGAATAAGCGEQVVGFGIVGIAHRISILVTVTKIE